MSFAVLIGLERKDVKANIIYYTKAKTECNFPIAIMPPVRYIPYYYRINGYGTKIWYFLLVNGQIS